MNQPTEKEQEREEVDVLGGDWYVSAAHVYRAIGYFYAGLVEEGALDDNYPAPNFKENFGVALVNTMTEDDPSPMGAI